jgi:hypothetical protein
MHMMDLGHRRSHERETLKVNFYTMSCLRIKCVSIVIVCETPVTVITRYF